VLRRGTEQRLPGTGAGVRTPLGRFHRSRPHLQVAGQTTVFAVGDILHRPTPRWPASPAIRLPRWRTTSTPWPRGDPTLPSISPWVSPSPCPSTHRRGGQFPGQDQIVGSETISEVKGRDLMVDQFGEISDSPHRRHPDRTSVNRQSAAGYRKARTVMTTQDIEFRIGFVRAHQRGRVRVKS